ncbi:MAG: CDC48 family AAA ATPase [Candidatus Aenigmatarchaeota archaeon]
MKIDKPDDTNEIKLKVDELSERMDFGKGIVRISARDMKRLGVTEGDIIELNGKRKTAAIAVRAYPADVGLDVVRMDGLARRNCGTGIGEAVKIKRADVKEAKSVTIAPARKGIIIHMGGNIFKQNLLMRPLYLGDIIVPNPIVQNRRETNFFEFFGFDMNITDMLMQPFGEEKFVVVATEPKGIVRVTKETDIELLPQATAPLEEEKIPDVTYEDLGGLHEEVQKVREMIELPLKHPELFERLGIEPPKGILLHGPPGTGKTLLAKAVANESGARFLVINGPEIMSKFYGESEENLRKKFEEAEKNAPSIIFIDEIDAIAPKREETRGEVERRVVSQLLTLLDGLKSRGKLIVIGATNIPNSIDPALRRPGRFDREIELGVPNKDGRKEILQIHTRGMPLSKDVEIDKISEITYGYVGADISALCKEAAMHALRRILPDLGEIKEDKPFDQELLKKLIVTRDDFDHALKMVEPSAMREVLFEVPNVKWADIGGLETVKASMKEAIEWPLKYADSFKNLGIRPPTGILLYGPPGCGKTMLAKAVANEAGANFISIKGPELLSMYVGESERHVREIFRRARQVAPSIIFFDEIDALVPKRGYSSDSHVSERVVSQLLAEISGLEELRGVVVIAATNRPDIMDQALLRPGRFDRQILVPTPDEKARLEILKVQTKGMPINEDGIKDESIKTDIKKKIMSRMASGEAVSQKDVDNLDKNHISGRRLSLLEYLAKETEGFSGADLEALCREAGMNAMRKNAQVKEIAKKDFDSAMKEIKPSVSEDMNTFYESLMKRKKSQKIEEEITYTG